MGALSMIADAMRSRILGCTALPREAREDVLRDIASIPLVLAETAHAQARLPRGSRKDPEEDKSEED